MQDRGPPYQVLTMAWLCRQKKLERELERHKPFADYLMKVLERIPKGTWLPRKPVPSMLGHSM